MDRIMFFDQIKLMLMKGEERNRIIEERIKEEKKLIRSQIKILVLGNFSFMFRHPTTNKDVILSRYKSTKSNLIADEKYHQH